MKSSNSTTKLHGLKISTHQNPKKAGWGKNIARLWKPWKGLSDPATLVLGMENSYDDKNSWFFKTAIKKTKNKK